MNKREMKIGKILQGIAEIAFERKDETVKNSEDKLECFSSSANYHFGIAEIKFTYNRK